MSADGIRICLSLSLALGCLAACSGNPPPAADSGVPGDGGALSDAGGGSAGDAGSLYVWSADHQALLWVPKGNLDGGPAISITRIDGGYELKPDGLTFNPPAVLLIKDSPSQTVGLRVVPTALVSAGSVENADTLVLGTAGPLEGKSVLRAVRVPHFTQVLVVDGLAGFLLTVGEPGLEQLIVPVGAVFTVPVRMEGAFPLAGVPSRVIAGLTLVSEADIAGIPYGKTLQLRCDAPGMGVVEAGVSSQLGGPPLVWAHLTVLCMAGWLPPTQDTTPPSPTEPTQTQTTQRTEEQALVTSYQISKLKGALSGWFSPTPPPPAVDLEELARRFNQVPAPAVVNTAFSASCVNNCVKEQPYSSSINFSNLGSAGLVVRDLTIRFSACLEVQNNSTGKFVMPLGDAAVAGGTSLPSTPYMIPYRCKCDGMEWMSGSFYAARADDPLGLFRSLDLDPRDSEDDELRIQCGTGKRRDAIMLSDNTRVLRAGDGGWAPQTTGVTANVINPSDAVVNAFTLVGSNAVLYRNVTNWTSVAGGPAAFTLSSSRQTATFTFNTGTQRYTPSGLVGSAAFNATDTLQVSATPTAGNPDGGPGPVVVTVAAPGNVTAPEAVLGSRRGLKTEVRFEDGSFDQLYIFVALGGAGAGEHGLIRYLDAAQLTLSGSQRIAPLLDDALIGIIQQAGLTPQTIYFAAYRRTQTDAYFPGLPPVPVEAGRMFWVSAADLAP